MISSSRGELERPVAFVLSGGASLGAVQVGMLRALIERGWTPDLVVGTSVGAINAAFAAVDFSMERIDELDRLWRSLRSEDIFPGLGLLALPRILRARGTLSSNGPLSLLLQRHLPDTHAELDVSAAVIAMDLVSGMPAVFDAGPLREHVLASASIPGVFPSIAIDGREYVDGGVAANVPVLQAHQLGVRTLVVLDAGYPCALERAPSGIVGSILHLVTLAMRHQSLGVLSLLARDVTVLYLPAPCPLRVEPHDFSHSGELIEGGYEDASRFLDELVVHGPGVYGHPHFHAASAPAPTLVASLQLAPAR